MFLIIIFKEAGAAGAAAALVCARGVRRAVVRGRDLPRGWPSAVPSSYGDGGRVSFA